MPPPGYAPILGRVQELSVHTLNGQTNTFWMYPPTC
jgi:hypothetical protein